MVTPLAALREALGPAAVSHTPCLTGVGLEPSDGLHTCTQAAAAAQVAAVVFVGGSSRNFACGDQQCVSTPRVCVRVRVRVCACVRVCVYAA